MSQFKALLEKQQQDKKEMEEKEKEKQQEEDRKNQKNENRKSQAEAYSPDDRASEHEHYNYDHEDRRKSNERAPRYVGFTYQRLRTKTIYLSIKVDFTGDKKKTYFFYHNAILSCNLDAIGIFL